MWHCDAHFLGWFCFKLEINFRSHGIKLWALDCGFQTKAHRFWANWDLWMWQLNTMHRSRGKASSVHIVPWSFNPVNKLTWHMSESPMDIDYLPQPFWERWWVGRSWWNISRRNAWLNRNRSQSPRSSQWKWSIFWSCVCLLFEERCDSLSLRWQTTKLFVCFLKLC